MKFFRMMKGLVPVLAAVAATTSCAQTSTPDYSTLKIPAEKQKFHIFLLTGQSNMEGAGYPVHPEYLEGTYQVLELNDNMEWVKNIAPYGRGYGPGESFALHYAKLHPDVTVGLIHAALLGALPQLLGSGEIKRLVIQRIDSLEPKELNKLLKGLMKKELAAIEWLGALLGGILGAVTYFAGRLF